MAARPRNPMRALLVAAGVLAPSAPVPPRDETARLLARAGWSASNIERVLGPAPTTAPQQSLAEPADLAGKARSATVTTPPAPRGPAASHPAAAAPLPRVDLVGRRFGRLLVLAYAGRVYRDRYYSTRCRCECGEELEVRVDALRRGTATSCGCVAPEAVVTDRELGEAKRELIVSALAAGAATLADLAARLDLSTTAVQRHLARLIDAGRVYRADGIIARGTLAFYALSLEAAHAALEARREATRKAPPTPRAPALAVPKPPSSQPRLIARVTPGWLNGSGDRHHNCARYDECLDAFRGAGDAHCPPGATDKRLGCFVERDPSIDFASAVRQRESVWGNA